MVPLTSTNSINTLIVMISSFTSYSHHKYQSKSFLGTSFEFREETETFASMELTSQVIYIQMHACSVLQLCLTLCDLVDCSPSASSVQGILQAIILEWVAISSSRGSFQPSDRTLGSCISCVSRQILCHCATIGAHIHRLP